MPGRDTEEGGERGVPGTAVEAEDELGNHRITLGADKAYDVAEFVADRPGTM